MNAHDTLFVLSAGSATRPGTPAALWLGAAAQGGALRRARRKTLRQVLASWFG